MPPPISEISPRVVPVVDRPDQKNSMPVITPWATIPKIAAWMPIVVSVAIPSITNPMWPDRRERDQAFQVLLRQTGERGVDDRDRGQRPIHGAYATAPSGSTGSAIRMNP